MKEKFLQNISLLERAFFESATFEYLRKTGLDKDIIAQLTSEIFKQSIQGALSLEEMEQKAKGTALELDKMRNEMELSILNAKMQIKQLKAEAAKSAIQAASIVRSVSDNAAINRANAYVSFLNTVGNASEQSAIQPHAPNVIKTINQINIARMPEFDNMLAELINEEEDEFGSKSVMIHTQKTLINVNENIEIKGISTYGENECFFSVNDKKVLSNSKNLIFQSDKEGDFLISFNVYKDKKTIIKDSLILKVIKGQINQSKSEFQKL